MITIATAIAIALPAWAGDSSQWANLQSLRRGDRIGIIQSDQKRIEGIFEGADESGITIESSGVTTLGKDNVARVYRRAGLSRTRRTLLCAAIGAAAGGIVAATAGRHRDRPGLSGAYWSAEQNAAWIVGGAGVGAGLGALSGSDRTIYLRTAWQH